MTCDSEAHVVHEKIRFDVVIDDRVVEREYFEESRLNLTWGEYEEGLNRAGFTDVTMYEPLNMWLGTRPQTILDQSPRMLGPMPDTT